MEIFECVFLHLGDTRDAFDVQYYLTGGSIFNFDVNQLYLYHGACRIFNSAFPTIIMLIFMWISITYIQNVLLVHSGKNHFRCGFRKYLYLFLLFLVALAQALIRSALFLMLTFLLSDYYLRCLCWKLLHYYFYQVYIVQSAFYFYLL